MALSKTLVWFSKPGKGYPQVPQLEGDGTPKTDSDGKPVIGNEQYQAEQLSDDSVSHESAEAFLTDVMESVNGDLETAAEMFRAGWNRITRLRAAGLDEYQKAAKGLIKLGISWTKGLSVDEVADKIREMS